MCYTVVNYKNEVKIMKHKKTNAARILDKLSIKYEMKEYEVDESDLSAVHVAESTGMPMEMVYKTLVVKGDKTGVIMAVIQGDLELNLKALAAVSGNKRVEMVHLKEVFALTGYIRGGCSPLGAKKAYPVYIDKRAEAQARIAVSAGIRGAQLILAPNDLLKATNGIFAAITASSTSLMLSLANDKLTLKTKKPYENS
ncbi:MAG: Cys-tRNA(Pro) deacylase [Selenomonadaceae bacterium]|nr:Cys-tRNA(Pro) deacylase [Selenomonadaceae bacterium]MBP3722521.1 Cys-tRNA(Pro) deacylase [Selenomonadaceae bacterium]